MVFFCGNFRFEFFGLFLFCFCLVRGEKVADTQVFGWQSKGEDHFRSWFPFFSCLLGDKSVLFRYCLVLRPFCIFLLFSSDLWSRILFLFCFPPFSLIGNFPFLLSSDSFDREFSPFLFFSFSFFLFSFEGNVYGELGLWLKACRTDGHDICQGVGLVQG